MISSAAVTDQLRRMLAALHEAVASSACHGAD